MKILKKIVLSIIIILILFLIAFYFYIKGTKPLYSGEFSIKGIKKEVKVHYDKFGIPHIYAQNEEDAYFALGYVYANDRLFQTELLKRLSSGRLAEILGKDLVKVDKYMRVHGLREAAEKSAKKYMSSNDKQYQKSFNAYLSGFNRFINTRNMPIEYKILGIPKEELKPSDTYSILNFIALGFTMPVHQESISAYINKKLGSQYVNDLYFGEKPDSSKIKIDVDTNLIKGQLTSNSLFKKTLEDYNLGLWEGSNAWVIGKEKSKSGKVLLANDTHFAYAQPSVWYEAEITYPGYNFYGFYLPGMPFPIIGHSTEYAWGLTIFPFDNANYYLEKIDSSTKKVLYRKEWVDLDISKQIIKVKNDNDINFEIWRTPHGPILNGLDDKITKHFNQNISLWWTLQKFETTILETTYNMSRTTSMKEFEKELANIDILGLNVMYGDNKDNIAFWSCGKLPVYNNNITPFTLLDGTDGKHEIDSFHNFSYNPHLINPPSHFVATANNDPVLSGAKHVPGHYLPTNRIRIINRKLKGQKMWDINDMKKLQLNTKSIRDSLLKELICKETKGFNMKNNIYQYCFDVLNDWDGNYEADKAAPLIFTKLKYFINKNTLEDELGSEMFDALSKTYLLKQSIERLYTDKNSPWWDNVNTKTKKESRKMIFNQSFNDAIAELEKEWGNEPKNWKWYKAHSLTFHHPFSKKKPMDKIFDVGPFAMPSGNGCLNKMDHPINNDKINQVTAGPALRINIDFADIKNAVNVIPTGQSGNVLSKHYDDQAQLFINGKYRKMIMQDPDVRNLKETLILKPEN